MTHPRPDAATLPADTGLAAGLVVAAHRRHYVVDLDAGGTLACVPKGRSMTLACGDRVHVARADSGGAWRSVHRQTTLGQPGA